MAKKEKNTTNTENKLQTCTKVFSDNNMKVIKKSRKAAPRDSPFQRSSVYRGVTRHRWTGRYEAHLWDKNCWNETHSKKGKQVYLGAYDDEEVAAHAYDLAALKYWGPDNTVLNFPLSTYGEEMKEMDGQSKEEYIGTLRRKSNGFSRGVSKYRGVARHHQNGRWEARIGRVFGNKYLYLGTYATQEEAAIAYDRAAIQHRGLNAVTNFDISRYADMLESNLEDHNSDLSSNNDMLSSVTCETNDGVVPNDHNADDLSNNNDSTNIFQQYLGSEISMYQYDDINTSSGALEILMQSESESIERTIVTSNTPPMSSCDNRKSKGSFPDDIQTYFGCQEGASYTEGYDYIFGDIDSILLPIFQCNYDS